MLKAQSKGRFSSIRQFEIIQGKKIGCGSFGTVKLARHRSTCRIYAVKIINLKDVPSEAEARLVERQIKLHSELDHPHIIKLWDTIADDDRIYMLMEYAEQGNLFYHQNTKTVFTEPEAFKFFTQTLQGVQYLHQHDIIHRDLKPQNLLLDSLFNIKICDFGWSAQDVKAKRTTFCGTYEYMAPQMLFKSTYDYRVDIWAMGILLYEMLHGCAPFKGKTKMQVQQQMIKGSYLLGKHLSEQAKNIINLILQFQPQKRPSIKEILQHSWIKDTQQYLNDYLKLQNIILPKDVHPKIVKIPPYSLSKKKIAEKIKHRKNSSLNMNQGSHNININLQINNFAFLGKNSKSNNHYHSQQKDGDLQQFYPLKHTVDNFNQKAVKKSKMEATCKTQASGVDVNHIIQKIQKNKSSKIIKHQLSPQQISKDKYTKIDGLFSKKKIKMRKSQAELTEKHPLRFNTEANQKEEWQDMSKLKKSGLFKNKFFGSSKNILKTSKMTKIE